MRCLIACIALCASPAIAEPHMMTRAFAERPCGETLDYIENPTPTPEGIGNMGMAFGYLLGFQAAKGWDLSDESDTILQRLVADCASSPDQTALALLERYSQ